MRLLGFRPNTTGAPMSAPSLSSLPHSIVKRGGGARPSTAQDPLGLQRAGGATGEFGGDEAGPAGGQA